MKTSILEKSLVVLLDAYFVESLGILEVIYEGIFDEIPGRTFWKSFNFMEKYVKEFMKRSVHES